MDLPEIISDLIESQNSFDSIAFAHCFSEEAIVTDEGKTYHGRTEIQHWIADANSKYETIMKPINFTVKQTESILTAELTGSFDGSPIVLHYHFKIQNNLIQSLKTTT